MNLMSGETCTRPHQCASTYCWPNKWGATDTGFLASFDEFCVTPCSAATHRVSANVKSALRVLVWIALECAAVLSPSRAPTGWRDGTVTRARNSTQIQQPNV